MFLDTLIILNYRSCRNLQLQFRKDEPNIFIGINDCGKTTILKAIGLLLDDKPNYHFVKENSSKRDLSNSPLSIEDLQSVFNGLGLPVIDYSGNQTVVVGKFWLEDTDIDDAEVSSYTNQLLWAVETVGAELWLARVYDSEKSGIQSYLLSTDCADQAQMKLWSASATDLNKKVKDYGVTDEDIVNTNGKGKYSNLEKVRAIYSKVKMEQCWTAYKIEKGDKDVFPSFRYLDWTSSLEDIKRTAADAMASKIEGHIKPLRSAANVAAADTEKDVNAMLEALKDSIEEMVPNITGIKTKVFFEVKESITDILINKLNADGDIHLDLQGEGVKRQIWFALIKAGALASIQSDVKNKKFIWAFDEPETHLFPAAQRQFFEIIKEVSKSNVQSIISTHSTVFIDKSNLKTIKSVSLKSDSYSDYAHCSDVDAIFNTLELRNSDFLFYDTFLVVEGETEQYLIPALYLLYTGTSLQENNIQLIKLRGSSKWLLSKEALENVFRDFKKSEDSIVYLFDADQVSEIGAAQKAENFYFAGKQDNEDAIDSKVWASFVTKATNGQVSITEAEVNEIKATIPDGKATSNQKFFSKLERAAKIKMAEVKDEQITYNVLPSKGHELAELLLECITSIDDVCPRIKQAFDKLSEFKATAGAKPTKANPVLGDSLKQHIDDAKVADIPTEIAVSAEQGAIT